jgi:hypothetical protein
MRMVDVAVDILKKALAPIAHPPPPKNKIQSALAIRTK